MAIKLPLNLVMNTQTNSNNVKSIWQRSRRPKVALVLNLAIALTTVFFASLKVQAAENYLTPPWIKEDVARKAAWLPASIRQMGLQAAYAKRMNQFPESARSILISRSIPYWMIALTPTEPGVQQEILDQIKNVNQLAGQAPESDLAKRSEELLVFAGALQIPSPGDNKSGKSLGSQGCTAALTKYILAQLKIEFPQRLADMPDELTKTQSSVEMKSILIKLAQKGTLWLEVKKYPFADLKTNLVLPGSLMIGEKSGGTHVIAWTRVPSTWGWQSSDKMAVANTGLPQFGPPRMILAQEYVSEDPKEYDPKYEYKHNEHGPINGRQVVYVKGKADSSDPRTNAYAVAGSAFIFMNFK